jgi:hypothetical protein
MREGRFGHLRKRAYGRFPRGTPLLWNMSRSPGVHFLLARILRTLR